MRPGLSCTQSLRTPSDEDFQHAPTLHLASGHTQHRGRCRRDVDVGDRSVSPYSSPALNASIQMLRQ